MLCSLLAKRLSWTDVQLHKCGQGGCQLVPCYIYGHSFSSSTKKWGDKPREPREGARRTASGTGYDLCKMAQFTNPLLGLVWISKPVSKSDRSEPP